MPVSTGTFSFLFLLWTIYALDLPSITPPYYNATTEEIANNKLTFLNGLFSSKNYLK
jgi:hypothetical protein